jgi:phosphoribosylaminoimidazole-succinocarboxamide synthase
MALKHLYTGKVREIYAAGDDQLLMIASDRISAFDVVFGEPVPDKGRVLTAMTAFWTEQVRDIAPTHFVTADPDEFPEGAEELGEIAGRAMLVRKAEMLPIECIVRGYLAGSAWKEYRTTGTMHGGRLPEGLTESERLPQPVFTPSTKATEGHDENISFDQAAELVGSETAAKVRDICIDAYLLGAERALASGIVVADTKFELGWIDGEIAICDEILTPDSSRFWPADAWLPGSAPPSFDKQPVRDWAESTGWDKQPPPPPLPEAVVEATRERYTAAYELVTGRKLADWYGGAGAHG